MDRDHVLELLNLQIAAVRTRLEGQEQRGENAWGTLALLRSLRLSLRAWTSGTASDEAAASFMLAVPRDGVIFLRRDNRLALLQGPFFASLLEGGGITVFPGEDLLIEPGLARRAIEESLGWLAAEERSREQRRADLWTAFRQSSGAWRGELLLELERLVAEEAERHEWRKDLEGLYGEAAGRFGAGAA